MFNIGLRIKGGCIFNPDTGKFHAVIHIWENPDGVGTPKEFTSKECFNTEEEAITFYERNIRPNLFEVLGRETSGRE